MLLLWTYLQGSKQYDPNEFKGAEAPHIPHEALETTGQLGEGEFGSVLRGIWHPGGNNQPRHVAIKAWVIILQGIPS